MVDLQLKLLPACAASHDGRSDFGCARDGLRYANCQSHRTAQCASVAIYGAVRAPALYFLLVCLRRASLLSVSKQPNMFDCWRATADGDGHRISFAVALRRGNPPCASMGQPATTCDLALRPPVTNVQMSPRVTQRCRGGHRDLTAYGVRYIVRYVLRSSPAHARH